MTKVGGSAPLGGPALQALQPKYTKDWSLHPLPITCRDQEHGDTSGGFHSILGLSSPNPDVLPWFFSRCPTRCDLGENRGARRRRISCQSSSILRTCCGFYLTRLTGGASRAEQEQEQPGLRWAGRCPGAPGPSLCWMCLL